MTVCVFNSNFSSHPQIGFTAFTWETSLEEGEYLEFLMIIEHEI